MDNYGFIIIRHVNSEKTNKYWNHSVKCLRTLYPNKKIVIIDDNSNQEFLKADFEYTNILIIKSEFKGRGELLPYYYYIKNKFFENAVIIHDSVFFHRRLNFENFIGLKVLPLWFFHPDKENLMNTLRISNSLRYAQNIQNRLNLKDESILGLPQLKWYGCFGVQSFINHNFLCYLEQKYNLTNMIYHVTCRNDRCCLERIFGCLFFTECQRIFRMKSLLGNIMTYQTWGYSFDEYERDFKKGVIPKAIVKVWTGR